MGLKHSVERHDTQNSGQKFKVAVAQKIRITIHFKSHEVGMNVANGSCNNECRMQVTGPPLGCRLACVQVQVDAAELVQQYRPDCVRLEHGGRVLAPCVQEPGVALPQQGLAGGGVPQPECKEDIVFKIRSCPKQSKIP